MIDLKGQAALVTGASRGIGSACALRLAQAGADVILNYVARRRAAEEVAGRILALGRRALVVKADVSEQLDVEQMVGEISERFGRLDLIVSNAATGGFRPLLENTTHQFQAAMATNVEALLHLLRASRELLGRSPLRAKVLAISSHGSRLALPDYGLIGMTKAALECAVRQSALELGPCNINVNALVSGFVATESTVQIADWAAAQPVALTRGQQLSADEVADVALFLLSPLSDQIQGQTIVVDGGASIAYASSLGPRPISA